MWKFLPAIMVISHSHYVIAESIPSKKNKATAKTIFRKTESISRMKHTNRDLSPTSTEVLGATDSRSANDNGVL